MTTNNSANGLITNVVSGTTSVAIISNTTYVIGFNNGSAVNPAFTLPSSPILGDYVEILGNGAGVNQWSILNPAATLIFFGTQTSSNGSGGIASTSMRDCIRLRYRGVNTVASTNEWVVVSAIGNLTLS